jgi:predicted AAA+ superfamily ATPase
MNNQRNAMVNIIGRKNEIEGLTTLYHSKKAEFVAVYGRRRVGKTHLTKELFRNKMAFFHNHPYNTTDYLLQGNCNRTSLEHNTYIQKQ